MRVILDTNLIISGVFWSGPPRQVLQHMREGHFQAFISEAMLDELRDVISRQKFEKYRVRIGKSPEELVEDYLQYAQIIVIDADIEIPKGAVRDGDDSIILAAALSVKANAIVTGDEDLLSLKAFREIPIISPTSLLDKL